MGWPYRTVDMGKGNSFFFLQEIDKWLEEAHHLVCEIPWPDLDWEGFADASAAVFARVNKAHPFREGNGRTSRVFMDHISELSCFRFNWSRIRSVDEWNRCSDISSMALSQREPESAIEALGPLFYDATVPGTHPLHILSKP